MRHEIALPICIPFYDDDGAKDIGFTTTAVLQFEVCCFGLRIELSKTLSLPSDAAYYPVYRKRMA